VSPAGEWVVFMVDERDIVACRLDGSGDPVVLTGDNGPDFSFDPVVSPDGQTVDFQGWSVPDMPWDAAARMSVRLDRPGKVEVWRPPGAAVQQPGFLSDGTPVAVTDATGWSNVWVGDRPLVGGGGEPFEHAGPTWGPRQRTWSAAPDGRRVAFARNEHGFGRLCVADVRTGAVTELGRGVHGQLCWRGERLSALRAGARTPTEVVVYAVGHGVAERRRIDVGPDPGWARHTLAEPEVVEAAAGNDVLHARRYASAGGGGAPRLLVCVHGGPTAQWEVSFLPAVPFWCSRGWDVLVVDPRGSTGHGRAYQQALRGAWGELDVSDTAALIRTAHERGWSSPSRTVVMGGSSGGLTVAGVLGRHGELVAAGVALYPVSDIADLSVRSHRFELHYNLSLVGPYETEADRARYEQRSPRHYAGEIRSPLLVLHGTDDPVVPADQSADLAAAIRRAGGSVELHLFEGEGHGFRRTSSKRAEYRLVEEFLERVVRPR
jgi:dipeptidyl aminopeptidase/acylaminoacyl peptidase